MIGAGFLVRLVQASIYIIVGLALLSIFLLVLTKGVRLFVTHFLAPLFGTELEMWGKFFANIGRAIASPFRRKGDDSEQTE